MSSLGLTRGSLYGILDLEILEFLGNFVGILVLGILDYRNSRILLALVGQAPSPANFIRARP